MIWETNMCSVCTYCTTQQILIMIFSMSVATKKKAGKKSQTDIIYYIAIEKRSWKQVVKAIGQH